MAICKEHRFCLLDEGHQGPHAWHACIDSPRARDDAKTLQESFEAGYREQQALLVQAGLRQMEQLPTLPNPYGAPFKAEGRTSDGVPYWKDAFAPKGGIFIGDTGRVHQNWDGVGDAAKELYAAKQALAVSEKERERLRAELEAVRAEQIGKSIDEGAEWHSRFEQAKRELENLKRETDMKLGDWSAMNGRIGKERDELKVQLAFLERELARERAANRKRTR